LTWSAGEIGQARRNGVLVIVFAVSGHFHLVLIAVTAAGFDADSEGKERVVGFGLSTGNLLEGRELASALLFSTVRREVESMGPTTPRGGHVATRSGSVRSAVPSSCSRSQFSDSKPYTICPFPSRPCSPLEDQTQLTAIAASLKSIESSPSSTGSQSSGGSAGGSARTTTPRFWIEAGVGASRDGEDEVEARREKARRGAGERREWEHSRHRRRD
jgi:hypothetical protein